MMWNLNRVPPALWRTPSRGPRASRLPRAALMILAGVVLAGGPGRLAAAEPEEGKARAESLARFEQQVAPILESRCLSCHNQGESKGGFSLETAERARAGGESGEVIIPSDPDGSYLLELVRSEDGRAAMPQDADPLTAEQVGVLRKWIKDGAVWPADRRLQPARVADFDWWSLQPLARPPLPTLDAARQAWACNPIDAFIAAGHAEHDLRPAPEADRRTLLRRLYFDLIGLPPTAAETRDFLESRDPAAYERVVDRLLASPRYGERWARHWLDVVHYADTHGYDKDKPRPHAWPYRDYVIRSLNADKPYARFVKEQLAGDVLYPASPDGLVATGFIAAGPWDFIGHAEVPESKTDGQVARNLDRDDMVSTTLNTFSSLTIQCARCHNHKFDPVTQEHYYRLQAVFAALDRADRIFDADPQVAAQRRQLEQRLEALEQEQSRVEQQLAAAKTPEILALEARIAAIRDRDDAPRTDPAPRSPAYGFHSQVAVRPDARKWVQVDLGRPIPLDQILLFGADEYGWSDFGFPARFRVEVASRWDAKNPEELPAAEVVADSTRSDFPRPGAVPVVIDGGGRTARYVRVTATRLWPRHRRGEAAAESADGGDWIFALGELAVVSNQQLARPRGVQALDSIEAPPRWSRENLIDGVHGRRTLDELTPSARATSSTNGYHSRFAETADSVKWVQLDLGAARPIDRIRLIPAYPTDWADTPGFGFPVRFRLEAADTPDFRDPRLVAARDEADFANPGTRPVVFDAGGLEVRYVRLTATRLWDRGGSRFALALAELEVESNGCNVALDAAVTALDSIDSGRWHLRHLVDGQTSRIALDALPERIREHFPADVDESLAELVRQRDALLAAAVDAAMLRERDAVAEQLAGTRDQLEALPPPQRVYAGVVHAGSGAFRGRAGLGPRPIRILHRGDVTKPDREVGPGTVPLGPDQDAAFDLPPDHEEGRRRAALAEWLVARDHPLTWRSIANRLWLYHFGRGIVDSPNDFGRMGQRPTHPELLDWLAVELRDGPPGLPVHQSWKRLHRLIVTSSVYRQAAEGLESQAEIDQGNRFLWKMNRRRLEAEAIRDTVLRVCGKLDLTMYGPGFQDFVIEKPQHSPHYEYQKHDPDDPATHRRAVYRFLVRSQQQPFMETLDCADPSQAVPKRTETLTSLQALTLLNNRFMLRMSEHLAERVSRERSGLPEQVDRAFRLTLGRDPSEAESQELRRFAATHGLANTCRLLFNLNEFLFVD